jgi:hypothetical protein
VHTDNTKGRILYTIILFMAMSLLTAAMAPLVSAALPVITWNAPLDADSNHLYADMVINVTTDITATCAYTMEDTLDGSPAGGGALAGDQFEHTASADVAPALAAGHTFQINMSCTDGGSTDVSNETRLFIRDPICEETITSSFTLGHNMDCNIVGTALTLRANNSVFSCGGYYIKGDPLSANRIGYGIAITPGSHNVTIRDCTITDFLRDIYASGSGTESYDLTI